MPVGRISILAVAETSRGRGIGGLLVEAAAARLKAAGCGLLEVTSNMKRVRAHAFYEKLGFERTSYASAGAFRTDQISQKALERRTPLVFAPRANREGRS